MQWPIIELRLLRYYIVVAEELNYRRAAKRLFISAPSLSAQIKQLEALLEVRLLERNTIRVRLTAAGEVLLHEARLLMMQANKMVELTKEVSVGNGGVLRLGYFDSCQGFFDEALASHQARFPKVEVALISLSVENGQAEALEDGRIQAGFVYGPRLGQMRDADHLLVMETPVCAVMGAHHPLALLKQVSLAELTQYPWMSTVNFHSQLLAVLAQYCKGKPAPTKMQMCDNSSTWVSSLIAGKHVAMVPRTEALAQNPRLAVRPVKELPADYQLQLHAVWKKSSVTPQVLNFVETLKLAGVKRG